MAGVEVFLLGLDDDVQVTDENGRYTFDSVPGGNIKVELDGTTATAPDGFFFPVMVSDTRTVPGATNFVMGMEEMFLPRLASSILQDVDASQTTTVTADEEAAPGLTPGQRSFLKVDVPADSLVAADGTKLAMGQVGISTVPAEIVREMLPPGILQHTFDITVQAPGITNFAKPAPITIPNMVGAMPGEQINLLSFNHTTGRLEIKGTMTVSADGLSATTDPGTGITHPGWHGGTRTGSMITISEPTEEGDEEPEIVATGMSTLFNGGGQSATIVVTNAGSPGMHQSALVTVDLIGIEEFAPGLGNLQAFELSPGQSATLKIEAGDITPEDLLRMNESNADGELYSGRVEITASAGGGSLDVNGESFEEYFYGQFFSAYFEINESGVPFEPTIIDATRDKKVDLFGHGEVDFDYDLLVEPDHFSASESTDTLDLSFAPDLPAGQQDTEMQIVGGLDVLDPDGEVLGRISLPATFKPTTQVFINEDDIAQVLDRLSGRLLVDNLPIVDDTVKRQQVADSVAARIRELLSPLGSSIQYVDTFGPNTISLNWGSSLEVNWTDDLSDTSPGDGFCDTGQTIDIDGSQIPMCTLRAAIEESNALTGGVNRVTFGIPEAAPGFDEGVFTITPQEALPDITNPVIIDALTQESDINVDRAIKVPVVELARSGRRAKKSTDSSFEPPTRRSKGSSSTGLTVTESLSMVSKRAEIIFNPTILASTSREKQSPETMARESSFAAARRRTQLATTATASMTWKKRT